MFTAAGTFACSFDVPTSDLEMRMEFEPDNKFDSNAVLLLLNNQKVGYVPRMNNRSINPSTSFIKDWKIRVLRGEISFIITTSLLAEKAKETEPKKEKELEEEEEVEEEEDESEEEEEE